MSFANESFLICDRITPAHASLSSCSNGGCYRSKSGNLSASQCTHYQVSCLPCAHFSSHRVTLHTRKCPSPVVTGSPRRLISHVRGRGGGAREIKDLLLVQSTSPLTSVSGTPSDGHTPNRLGHGAIDAVSNDRSESVRSTGACRPQRWTSDPIVRKTGGGRGE